MLIWVSRGSPRLFRCLFRFHQKSRAPAENGAVAAASPVTGNSSYLRRFLTCVVARYKLVLVTASHELTTLGTSYGMHGMRQTEAK